MTTKPWITRALNRLMKKLIFTLKDMSGRLSFFSSVDAAVKSLKASDSARPS